MAVPTSYPEVLSALVNKLAEYPMKISARNFLKGKVAKVIKGSTTAHVLIDVNGATIMAAITNEAVEDLTLREGMNAAAVIKATDVMIATE